MGTCCWRGIMHGGATTAGSTARLQGVGLSMKAATTHRRLACCCCGGIPINHRGCNTRLQRRLDAIHERRQKSIHQIAHALFRRQLLLLCRRSRMSLLFLHNGIVLILIIVISTGHGTIGASVATAKWSVFPKGRGHSATTITTARWLLLLLLPLHFV